MRAFLRRTLAPLAVAGAVLSAAPAFASTPAVHPSVAMDHPCPPGTNWDSGLQACV
jgi:hypothetical protein